MKHAQVCNMVYASRLHVHFFRLYLFLHLLSFLLLCFRFFLGSGRRGRSGWWRCWLAHDLLHFVVDFPGLLLDLVGSDNKVFPFGPSPLFLVGGSDPGPGLIDKRECFLSFFRSDVFVLFILNRRWVTSELRRLVLAASESPRAATQLTSNSKCSYRLAMLATLFLTPLMRSLQVPRLEFCPSLYSHSFSFSRQAIMSLDYSGRAYSWWEAARLDFQRQMRDSNQFFFSQVSRMRRSWLTMVDSAVKKVSMSLLLKLSKVFASNLMAVYFSFLVFFTQNSSYSIFSASPSFLGYSFLTSFFLGILLSSNHSYTSWHSSKVTSPSSVYLSLKVTPQTSVVGCCGLVTQYPMCFPKPLMAGSYSMRTSMASLRVNLMVLLVGTFAPASQMYFPCFSGQRWAFKPKYFSPSTKFQQNLTPQYTRSCREQSETLKRGLLMAAISAHPRATDSLEFSVREGYTPKTCFTRATKAGILDPPPISQMLWSGIFLALRLSRVRTKTSAMALKMGWLISSNFSRVMVYCRSLSSIRYSILRSCSLLPERILRWRSICSMSLTIALRFSERSLPPEDFSNTLRQNSYRWQSMSRQPMWRLCSCSRTFISALVKEQAKSESLECPKSMKRTFRGLVASSSFLRNMPQSRAMAVDSLRRRVMVNSAMRAASQTAFRSCCVKQVGTASTAALFSKLFFCRMNLSLLMQAAKTCSGKTVSV